MLLVLEKGPQEQNRRLLLPNPNSTDACTESNGAKSILTRPTNCYRCLTGRKCCRTLLVLAWFVFHTQYSEGEFRERTKHELKIAWMDHFKKTILMSQLFFVASSTHSAKTLCKLNCLQFQILMYCKTFESTRNIDLNASFETLSHE